MVLCIEVAYALVVASKCVWAERPRSSLVVVCTAAACLVELAGHVVRTLTDLLLFCCYLATYLYVNIV